MPKVYAQSSSPQFDRLTIEQGLSSNVVFCIFQDSDGFLWFGSNAGLDRYDGYRFKNYRKYKNDTTSLSNDLVFSMAEDKSGYLWIGTYDGLNKFDKRTGKSIRYFNILNDSTSLSYSKISDLFVDKNDNLWAGTWYGLAKFLPEQNKFKNYFASGEKYNKRIFKIITNLKETGKTVAAIKEVTNNKKLSAFFELKKRTKTLVYYVGEITYDQAFDFGWIENSKGKTIWTVQNRQTFLAGGHSKNHTLIDVIELPAGKYSLKFISDRSHSFGVWNSKRPDRPEDWGIQLFVITPEEENSVIAEKNNMINVNGISQVSVNSIAGDDRGNLILGTGSGLSVFNPITERSQNYLIKSKISDPANKINAVCIDSDGNVWAGTDDGLFIFDRAAKSFEKIKQLKEDRDDSQALHIKDICQSGDGYIWVTTNGNKIVIIEPKTREIKYITNNTRKNEARRNVYMGKIYKDRAGSLWISNWLEGVWIYHPTGKKINIYKKESNNSNSLSNEIVTKALKDENGDLWIATDGGGLNKYSFKEKKFTRYQEDTVKKFSDLNNKIFTIFLDSRKNLWLGKENGVSLFDRKTGLFTKIKFPDAPLDIKKVNAIGEDKEGNLIIASQEYLIYYNPKTLKAAYHKVKPYGNTFIMLGFSIEDFLIDRNNNIWVTTWEGLGLLNKEKNEFEIYLDRDFEITEENHFWTMHEDKDGIFWLGSQADGLKRFDPVTKKFTSFKKEQGLLSNNVFSILEEEDGFLWLGTELGLSRFDKRRQTFSNFTVNDGLPSNCFVPNAAWKAPDGEMFFGTKKGLISFRPRNFQQNKYLPPVAITSFKVFNKEYRLNTDIAFTDEITLKHSDNVFSFEFSALNFVHPQSNQYAYKLEGFNDNWIMLGNKREVTYTNLDPGRYQFMIKASNNDGLWNETGKTVRFVIQPPWWKTWWAYLIYALIIISIYLRVRKYELNKLKLQNEAKLNRLEADKLMEADKVKSAFFTNISHEFRTPLTLIIEPVEKLKMQLNDSGAEKILGMVGRNARRLLQLINQILDLSKLEARSMKLQVQKKNVIPFIKGCFASFESAAKLKQINYEIEIKTQRKEMYFDSDKLQKIIFNLLSNALKFTKTGGKVWASVEVRDKYLLISIRDDGIGIPADQIKYIFNRFFQVDRKYAQENGGSGIGLALTKELVELHNGNITVKSLAGEGTTFSVKLPTEDDIYYVDEIIDPAIEADAYPPDFLNSAENTVNPQLLRQSKSLVLLIEDNSDMRNFILQSLEEDFQVVTCANGLQGIEKTKEVMPDLVLSDVMMPAMDGFEVCRQIRSSEITSHIPVILLTAKVALDDKIEGLEIGADDYITKPFNSKELITRIRNLIDLRKRIWSKISDSLLASGSTKIKILNGLTKFDKQFIERVYDIVEKNYTHPEFNVEFFSSANGMSPSQLRRKMTVLFNKSPNEFIRSFRLQKAAKSIIEEGANVSEAAFACGFNSLPYFTKCFQKEFGKLPSDLIK
ncbi:MAG: response regulator [Calditrichaeota bacterium]|nr:response regulator [Calditrichota bacterium]